MFHWISTLQLLAEDAPAPKESPLSNMLIPLMLIVFVGYFLMFRPQQKERARREKTLSELKKNDRVVTIGGMVGSIGNISQDGREVTLKIDDNTRVTMLRSSIQGPYSKGDDESSEKK